MTTTVLERVKMENQYAKLFEAMKIGKMTLKNRLVMAPMGTFTPMQDGTESEEGIAYYEERARGGIGMIIIGAQFLNEKTAQGGPTMSVDNNRAIPKATVLCERVHRWGAKICAQISPGTGRNGMPDIGERVPISSSENPSFYNPEMICRALSTEEIKDIMKDWAQAALFAKKAGFDAIEIHGHAGYLIDQFLSPIWNKRTDEYGGSFENRARFAVETVQTIREAVGPDMPILFRISLDHRFEGGRTIEDSMPLIELLEKAGVDALDIDAGAYETMDFIFPPSYLGDACMGYVCEEARKHVSIPLLNAGSHTPETALQLVNSGNCDFVMFGRQMIADPEFPKKLMENRREDIRPCLLCNEECIGRVFNRTTQISCTVNPQVCMEKYFQIEKTSSPQNIVVIGAGPGGLEAARVAALKGHHVTVYDKSETLGGTFGVIATGPFKKRIRDLITWYGVQLSKLNVQVNLNTEINVDDPILEAADKIFVATGAVPFVPNIPGIESSHVLGVVDAHQNGVEGEKIVVCGGGMSGCDTALELALEGKQVTIVEMLSECARDVMVINKISLMRQLAENNVTLLTDSKVVSVDETGVTIEKKDGTVELVPADTVITAFGQKPSTDFPDAVRKQYNIKTTVIGDAEKVSKAANAIHTGFYAAMAIE
ncbi:2,4-dienoyl-CoA reductase-like NADH-dependent reductase (Old Yellow Enzyme family)/NADPH-dependent 2,4-dienoyl-CoA reductase/sulfur reductase-like enzyme [Neobacillus niacini]|uniref:oxidoreductase n=1 Tax=Neobacillus niacini TaxID=86668 RepID=UPI0028565E93|nr:FAD-dependent oxidoreductase [Neobacillus niacini]MDR7075788.1 2,4-dienoyl-CoA reductase-like NADH-dependent reductase (Old Yellow Enzyme family)/NADPH-dependent 2,4-dienoyl-CoA reductase/sulfur reductase-like enzyme [Neobacillus niacini]